MVLENLYLKIIISKQALLKLLFIERKKKISSNEYIFPLRILNTSRQEFMPSKKDDTQGSYLTQQTYC